MNLQTLRERQQWTLQQKIDHSLGVIEAFNAHFDGQVFVSFSGGKDSCVMLSLVEMVLPQVPVAGATPHRDNQTRKDAAPSIQ